MNRWGWGVTDGQTDRQLILKRILRSRGYFGSSPHILPENARQAQSPPIVGFLRFRRLGKWEGGAGCDGRTDGQTIKL